MMGPRPPRRVPEASLGSPARRCRSSDKSSCATGNPPSVRLGKCQRSCLQVWLCHQSPLRHPARDNLHPRPIELLTTARSTRCRSSRALLAARVGRCRPTDSRSRARRAFRGQRQRTWCEADGDSELVGRQRTAGNYLADLSIPWIGRPRSCGELSAAWSR